MKTSKEIFESKQWDMIEGLKYLDEEKCIALIEELTTHNGMSQIRKWFDKHWRYLEIHEDIEDSQDVCNIIWYYEKTRSNL